MSCHHADVVDPEITRELEVSNVTRTTVVLSWSIGNTRHIDRIQVMKRQVRPPTSAAVEWLSASSNSSHTVQMLTPGTTYEFSVQIDSFNYTARTDTAEVTTDGVIGELNCSCILILNAIPNLLYCCECATGGLCEFAGSTNHSQTFTWMPCTVSDLANILSINYGILFHLLQSNIVEVC